MSVAFCALRDLATRQIPAKIPSLFITLLTTVTVTTAGGAILVPLGGWTPPSANALGLQALAAVLLLIGYQCIITALRSGDISAVAPFRYSALLWAMLLGYLVFGDVPDAMMVLGAPIIVLSGLYAFYRERIRHRALAAEIIRPAARRVVIIMASVIARSEATKQSILPHAAAMDCFVASLLAMTN